MIKGKLNWFTRKDIIEFDWGFRNLSNLSPLDEMRLYDLLEEQMLEMGFVMYDDDFAFEKEVVFHGWHWRRYNCMVLKGKRRNGMFVLSEVGIQFRHIK